MSCSKEQKNVSSVKPSKIIKNLRRNLIDLTEILTKIISEPTFEQLISGNDVLLEILSNLDDRRNAMLVNSDFYAAVCEIEKFNKELFLRVSKQNYFFLSQP
jgi:uncharacterized protein YjgD (DUF1641 family)